MPPSTSEDADRAARTSRARERLPARAWLFFACVVLVCAALDVTTKDWAFERVPEHHSEPIVVIDGFFYIVHATNTGAMWSLFQDINREVWILIRGGVFLILLTIVVRSMPTALWARLGFALVLAGALGNLHDNLFLPRGAVRDWLRFDFGSYHFPIFNLADSFICIGAPLLLLYFYRHEDHVRAEKGEGGGDVTGSQAAPGQGISVAPIEPTELAE